MITLVRDREPIYYAIYSGVEEIQKDGLYTGGRRKVYQPVQKAMLTVSGARTAYGFVSNVVQMEFFGLDKPYSKTMWTCRKDLGLTEETILWLDMGNLKEYDPSTEYSEGDKVIHDGKIYESTTSVLPSDFDSSSWKLVPHNYIVTGISKTPNSIGYAIKEVDFRADSN